MTRWVWLLGLVAVACGSDVTVGDDDPRDDDFELASDTDLWDQRSAPDSGCRACATDHCGWCAFEGGDASYQCWSDRVPRDDMHCMQTGSVYHDEDGPYICVRCFER